MSLPLVIGITGRKRSGKSTLARQLVQRHGFVEKSFATPLKEAALALNPIVDYGLGNPAFGVIRLATVVKRHGWEYAKDHYPEVRRTLQRLGTDVVRNRLGANVWVDLAGPWPQPSPTVLADCRFDNEARRIRESGGIVVEVVRPGLETGDGHASEAGISSHLIACRVVNDGTPEQLYERAAAEIGLTRGG